MVNSIFKGESFGKKEVECRHFKASNTSIPRIVHRCSENIQVSTSCTYLLYNERDIEGYKAYGFNSSYVL